LKIEIKNVEQKDFEKELTTILECPIPNCSEEFVLFKFDKNIDIV